MNTGEETLSKQVQEDYSLAFRLHMGRYRKSWLTYKLSKIIITEIKCAGEWKKQACKEEVGLGEVIKAKRQASSCFRAVVMYKSYKPNLSLQYQTPDEVHKNSLLIVTTSRE